MTKSNRYLVYMILFAFGLSACVRDEYGNERKMTDSEKGAIIGATLGALLGLTSKKKRSKKVLLGAVGGGLAGYAVGSYMDSQKRDLKKQLAEEVSRGAINIEGDQRHNILVTMTGETAFEVNSSRIKRGFHSTMYKISKVVNRYGKTSITIIGHTDSTGTHAYNQKLSERRANAVKQYFLEKKVAYQRLSHVGQGETMPRASNNTDYGRRLNRRVDIVIEPVVAN